MKDVNLQKRIVSDISIMEVFDSENREQKPIIFIFHGASGRTEADLDKAMLLANEGYYVVLIDAYGYGESIDSVYHDEYNPNDPMEIFRIYTETSTYINKLVHYYSDDFRVNTSRIGLLGFSMGAHIIYYYLANQRIKNIKVAIPIIGSPNWNPIVGRFIRSIDRFEKLNNDKEIKKYEEQVSKINPYNQLINLKSIYLLIINGTVDPKIDINDIRQFYSDLKPNFDNVEYLQLIEYKEVGHKVTEDMMNSALSWFKLHL
ncbi:hypothetical protein SAMN03159341_1443 [Paenibacillus sp. 1_12]|uniref:alpha/beta hydrolase family protein n=1 Tax=Paenibacillus sp. 1_12 TaxID=1566278 RepID=UPI0008E1C1A1|nr:dienelactone hydrolase family protein [Paenibacillus sp. 1_12]SFM53308.1 hypothetical protein SAMN03159341_1443 [Paenibacillus sp. 1_12]